MLDRLWVMIDTASFARSSARTARRRASAAIVAGDLGEVIHCLLSATSRRPQWPRSTRSSTSDPTRRAAGARAPCRRGPEGASARSFEDPLCASVQFRGRRRALTIHRGWPRADTGCETTEQGVSRRRPPAARVRPRPPMTRRVPWLDGVRGVAILLLGWSLRCIALVPSGHITGIVRTVTGAGWIGVNLFFILSGFLITRSLLDSRGQRPSGSPGSGRRRAARIFPAILRAPLAHLGRRHGPEVDLLGVPGQLAVRWDRRRTCSIHGRSQSRSSSTSSGRLYFWRPRRLHAASPSPRSPAVLGLRAGALLFACDPMWIYRYVHTM